MFALLRVIIVEWILARLALRWVLTVGVLAIGGLIFFIGLPTILIIVGLVLAWRWFKRAEAKAAVRDAARDIAPDATATAP